MSRDLNNMRDKERRYYQAIHDVLIEEWDPIGVGGVPEAQDEYDAYVPGVYRHLVQRSPMRDLANYYPRKPRLCRGTGRI